MFSCCCLLSFPVPVPVSIPLSGLVSSREEEEEESNNKADLNIFNSNCWREMGRGVVLERSSWVSCLFFSSSSIFPLRGVVVVVFGCLFLFSFLSARFLSWLVLLELPFLEVLEREDCPILVGGVGVGVVVTKDSFFFSFS